jgi:hypothetical protein
VIDLSGSRYLTMSSVYTGRSGTSKARFKLVFLRDTVAAGVADTEDLGQETEHASASGVYSPGNDVEYETDAPGTGVDTDPWLALDNRVVSAFDKAEVYIRESGDAGNPGDIVLNYVTSD